MLQFAWLKESRAASTFLQGIVPASLHSAWRDALQKEISSLGQSSNSIWPCQALACCDFSGTFHSWAGINSSLLNSKATKPGSSSTNREGLAGDEGAAHGTWAGGGTAGQPWVTAMALLGWQQQPLHLAVPWGPFPYLLVKSLKHRRSLLWCLKSFGSLGISDKKTCATSNGPFRRRRGTVSCWELSVTCNHWRKFSHIENTHKTQHFLTQSILKSCSWEIWCKSPTSVTTESPLGLALFYLKLCFWKTVWDTAQLLHLFSFIRTPDKVCSTHNWGKV